MDEMHAEIDRAKVIKRGQERENDGEQRKMCVYT